MGYTASNTKHDEKRRASLVRPVLMAAGFTLLLLLVLSLILSGLFASIDISAVFLTPAAVLSLAVSCFAGGFFAARITKARGLTAGVLMGGTVYGIMLMLSLLFVRSGVGVMALAKLLLMLTACGVGGILGVNLFTKRK